MRHRPLALESASVGEPEPRRPQPEGDHRRTDTAGPERGGDGLHEPVADQAGEIAWVVDVNTAAAWVLRQEDIVEQYVARIRLIAGNET